MSTEAAGGTIVGEFTVLPVLDGTVHISGGELWRMAKAQGRGARDADWEQHADLLSDGLLELFIGGFLVLGGGRTTLVDLGIGTEQVGPFKGGAFLSSLRALGVEPNDVTDVVFTHLHGDHVGWAAPGGVATFQRARHHVHERDWAHFVGRDQRITAKVSPIEPMLQLWSGPEAALLPGLDGRLAAGHTPGNTYLVVSSGSERAMLLGDVAHCPIELVDDEWDGLGDLDPDLARATRIALMRELEGTQVRVAGTHFPGMRFGRLLPAQGRRQWIVP